MNVTCSFSEEEIQKILSRYVFEHVYVGTINDETHKLDTNKFTIGNNSIHFYRREDPIADNTIRCELSFSLSLEDIENIKKGDD